jgi:hypothetical protein
MSKHRTPFELQQKGMEILVRELGHEEALRFMPQFRRGSGDYTKDRKAMLAGANLEGLLGSSARRVKSAKSSGATRRRSA